MSLDFAPPPDQAERERALDIGISALTIAPAGSGKTTLLVARALKCLAVSNEPEEVVALTFTNKAAAEIRARLVEALQAAQGPAPDGGQARATWTLARAVLERSHARGWQLPDNPNRLRALTLDAFNAELAARLPLLSGLGGPAAIAEDGRGLFEEAVQSLYAELEDDTLAAEDREALQTVLRWGDNRLDRLLEPFATMLEKREQWLEPMTDLQNAAETRDAEVLGALVQQRLQALDRSLTDADKTSLISVLHEGAAQAEKLAWAAGLQRWPEPDAARLDDWQRIAALLITQQGELRRQVNATNGFVAGQDYSRRMRDWLQSLQEDPRGARIAAAATAVAACPPASYPEHLRWQRQAFARVLLRLAAHLRVVFGQRGQADFTEVALAAHQALAGEQGYSELLGRVDARIRHLLVDEMQDTSAGQVRLLKRLTSGWVPGDGHSLFMVGDPQQSIYAFRKAEVRLFLELWTQQRLGEVPLTRIRLTTNFRSSAPLIDWFNRSFGAVFPETSDLYADAVAYNPCEPAAHSAREPQTPVMVVPLAGDAETAEAEAVAARAAQLLQSGGSVAILARARPHLWHTLAALRRQGIPHSCQDIDPLHDIPAVREYVQLARALWHPEDRLAWAVVLRSPLVGLSWADLLALSRGAPKRSWPQKIRDALAAPADLSPEGHTRLSRLQAVLAQAEDDPLLYGDLAARAEAVWHALGGPATVPPDALADLRIAMRHLRTAAASGEIASLAALRRSFAQVYATPKAGAVQVLTAHKAKGLEFDHVLLAGCGRVTQGDDRPLLQYRAFREGLLLVPQPPDSLPEDDPAWRLYDFMRRLQRDAARHELLRLLYVACTRARRTLTLFANLGFDKDGTPKPRSGSFAELLWPAIGADCANLAPSDAEDDVRVLRVPRSPRLPVDYRFEPDDRSWRPQASRSLRPSEAVLDAQQTKPREGDVYAQLIGVMYHEAMRRIAQDGVAAWRDGGASRRAAMAAGFRHRGLPEPLIATAVQRVLELLRTTLDSEAGRWLLAPREWSQSEYALAGYRDGQWVSAIIDRCFEDHGQLWVIDYKTTTEPAAEAAARYREQLRHYAALLGSLRGKPVRCALFLADSGRLEEIG
ncbi:MAG TPA: UvrD-helicase domain-containing protein [Nevskiales bacterium]|nr:UvrD-helicase domain-containing protein [Nevskiales bacterium]